MLGSTLDKRILQHLSGGGPHFRILGETQFDKFHKFIAPSATDGRGYLLYNIEDNFLLRLIYVWWVTIRHFHSEDAQTPNIYFRRVLSVSFNELWRHPADSAHFALSG